MWSAIEEWARRFGSIFVFVILARLLAPDDFGLAAIALVFVLFLGMIQYSGPVRALVQYDRVTDADLHTGFWLGLLMAGGMVVIMVAAAPWIATAFGDERLTSVLRVGSLALVAGSSATVPTALMMRELDFRSLAYRNFGAMVVSGVLAIVLALRGAGVWALIWQNIAFSLVQTVLVWIRTPYRAKRYFGKAEARALLGLSWRFSGADLLWYSDKRSADVLIGGFLGATALGFYSVAYRLLDVLTSLFVEAFANVTRPLFARVQKEPERFLGGLHTALRQSAAISFPAFVGMAVMATEITAVVFGAQWTPSIPVMRLLAIVGLASVLEALLANAIAGIGRVSQHLWIRAGSAVGNVAVLVVVAMSGGDIVAFTIALAAWRVVYLPVYFVVLRRALPFAWLPILSTFIGPLVAALAMAAVVVGARQVFGWQADIVGLLVGIAIGACGYLATMAVVSRRSIVEALDLTRKALRS